MRYNPKPKLVRLAQYWTDGCWCLRQRNGRLFGRWNTRVEAEGAAGVGGYTITPGEVIQVDDGGKIIEEKTCPENGDLTATSDIQQLRS